MPCFHKTYGHFGRGVLYRNVAGQGCYRETIYSLLCESRERTVLIKTNRLKTRQATSKDAEFFAQVLTNTEVQKYTGGIKASFDQTLQHIKRSPCDLNSFYIIETSSKIKIGYLAFVPNSYFSEDEPLISLLPEYWRKGYGSEILATLKEKWLQEHDQMSVTVNPQNVSSIELLRKHGFVYVEEYQQGFNQKQHVYRCPIDKFT